MKNRVAEKHPVFRNAHDDRKELWHRLRVSVKGAMSKKLIAMNERELSISDRSPRAQAELRQYSRDLLMGFAVFDITCAILISLFIAVEIKKRLDRLVENTTRLGIGKELLPHIKGNDELSVLDSSFHNMADLLNEASRKIFLADAKPLLCIAHIFVSTSVISMHQRRTCLLKFHFGSAQFQIAKDAPV